MTVRNNPIKATFPIFVLTLSGDADRRAPLLEKLEALELSYELVFGIDGRKGLSTEYEQLIDREGTPACAGRKLSEGEYACALSHRSIYNRIIDQGLPGGIILEDDAILMDDFAKFVRSGDFEQAPMILLDYAFGRALPFRVRKMQSGMLHRCANQPTMASAYSISNVTAQRLLSATTPVRTTTDWPTSLYHLDAWIAVPRLARHQAPESGRLSHLDEDRNKLEKTKKKPNVPGTTGFGPKFRIRLSVRVGRAKGER